jgi:glycosyltransferase involved in cell wall biosynthesis
MPARVSIFLPSLAGGGAERAISTLAGGLAARGAEVCLVLGQARGPYLGDVDARVRIVDLHRTSLPAALPALVRHLRDERPDALLAAMSHANVVAALAHRLARSKARLVLSERVHVSSLFLGYRGWRMRLTRTLMRLTYPWAERMVTVSDGVAQDLLLHVPLAPSRVLAIPNPVVDEALHARAAAAPAHAWLASRDVPVLLGVGRLNAQKDFATLIAAFASLRRTRPLRLLILGEGEERGALLEQARSLGVAGDVALPGFDANPFAAMRACSAFVLSSRYEGLPGVLIQAMACGARVVSTDCPSGPSEVLQGGRWGRLVPVGDSAAMAAAIAATLDDPAPPDARLRAADYTAPLAVQRYAEVLGLP